MRIRALPLPVVVLALENGVVEEVIDDLSGGGALARYVACRIELVDDVLGYWIDARRWDAIVEERGMRQRVMMGLLIPVNLRWRRALPSRSLSPTARRTPCVGNLGQVAELGNRPSGTQSNNDDPE